MSEQTFELDSGVEPNKLSIKVLNEDTGRFEKTDLAYGDGNISGFPAEVLADAWLNFERIDASGNDFLSKGELDGFLADEGNGLSASEREHLEFVQDNFDGIKKAHNDRPGKERRGLSRQDLESFALMQMENLNRMPDKPGTYLTRLRVDGTRRRYMIHIPESYDGKTMLPLVLMLHGTAQNGRKFARHTQMNELADRNGFIAVYPYARRNFGMVLRSWKVGKPNFYQSDDRRFMEVLMDTTGQKLAVDQSSTYMAGYSNGAMLAHELAIKMPDRFAAVAAVSGSMNGSEVYSGDPVPVMMIHGTRDKMVPLKGRSFPGLCKRWMCRIKPLSYAEQFWQQNNGAGSVPSVEVKDGIEKRTYPDPEGSNEVVVYTIEGGNHVWPGSDTSIKEKSPSQYFPASDAIWDFFQDHRKEKP